MTHKRKSPTWVRLKETKQALKVLRAVVVRQATELKTAQMVAAHYEKSYRWAMDEVNTMNNRQQRLLDLLNGYVERNVEQKKRIEALTAQQPR